MSIVEFKKPKKHKIEFSYLTYGITCGECKEEFERVSGNMEVNAGRLYQDDRIACPKCKTELRVEFEDFN